MHDIIIILDRTECLQGAIVGAGHLEEIKSKAVEADAFLQSSNEEQEALHEWLENTQSALVSACATFSDLNDNCPKFG